MKKSFKFLGGYLIGVLLVCIGALISCTSCSNTGSIFGDEDGVSKEYVDSVVAANIQNLVNPVFTEVDAVLAFKSLSLEGEAIDNAFNELSDELLTNVATVCIRRDGYVSKRGIVYEYRANPGIYDNLPGPKDDSTKTDAITEESKSDVTSTAAGGVSYRPDSNNAGPKNETSFRQHDTIVNGKPYKVHIKQEKTYEQN